jgi:D-alanine--poly(phosphoribitol) ligase subunit 1
MISHGSLLDYFYNHNQVLRYTPDSRVLSFAPFHFDASIEDTLLPLSIGAFVYQYKGMPIGVLVQRVLKQHRITHLIAISTILTVITDGNSPLNSSVLPDLEMVMTGGELCDPKVINKWKTNFPQPEFTTYTVPQKQRLCVLLTRSNILTRAETGPTPLVGHWMEYS